jgi:hypothetical protein
MRCFYCRNETGDESIRCDKCADAALAPEKYSIAKKLEMAEKIKGIDILEKQI